MLDRAALWIYGTVFFSILATGLGAPFPEELPIVASGVTCGHVRTPPDDSIHQVSALFAANPLLPFPANVPWEAIFETPSIVPPEPVPAVRLHWYVMLPICVLGVVIGDGFLYGIGRIWGTRLVETRWMKRVLPEEKKVKIEENFHRYGIWVLLFARLLPTIRAPIYLMAGVTRIPFSRFVLADGLYAIRSEPVFFGLLAREISSKTWSSPRSAKLRVTSDHRVDRTGRPDRIPHLSFLPPSGNRRPALEVPVIGGEGSSAWSSTNRKIRPLSAADGSPSRIPSLAMRSFDASLERREASEALEKLRKR